MKISSAFPSRYLKAADLPDGRDVRVTIDDVQMEVMEQQNEEKPVLYFVGKEKGLVLNVTNATSISAVLGDDTETWRGQTIMLFNTTTNFGGRVVPCIRVRVARAAPARVPQEDTAAPNQEPNEEGDAAQDDIPF